MPLKLLRYNKNMPQLRQNIVTGEWVVIAPERAKRPSDFIAVESLKPTHSSANCPFCPDGVAYRGKLDEPASKNIYVIANDFPAFLEDERLASSRSYRVEDGFYNMRPASGGHDVIIIKTHDWQLFDFTPKIWAELFLVAKKRYQHWRTFKNVRYSMLIYNQGPRAGASVAHPHAQLMASNIIPNQISKELNGAQSYFEENGTCVFCDLIEHERREKIRLIEETPDFVVFTFYAARFPFEAWVLPKKHVAHFEEESEARLAKLGKVMYGIIARYGKLLHQPSINFFLHDLPNSVDDADYYHWHIEITPRVSTYGGYELGSGTVIDVMSPEEAAKYLRKS